VICSFIHALVTRKLDKGKKKKKKLASESATKGRTDDRRNTEYSTEETEHPGTERKRRDFCDDGDDGHKDSRGPETLRRRVK
jgi:hypothetical protein